MQALLFFACKKYSSYNRDNSLTVERHFGGGKGSTPFYFFCRTQVTKGGSMVIELVIAGYILIFLLGVILGNVLKPKPHCSGKLIVDETGETERWSFMLDDPLDEVREQKVIFLEVDRRA